MVKMFIASPSDELAAKIIYYYPKEHRQVAYVLGHPGLIVEADQYNVMSWGHWFTIDKENIQITIRFSHKDCYKVYNLKKVKGGDVICL